MAAWVLAKIAYKRGDLVTAKEFYFKALIAAADKKTPKLLQEYIAQENYIIQNVGNNSPIIKN